MVQSLKYQYLWILHCSLWYEVVVVRTYFGNILQVTHELHHFIVYACLQVLTHKSTYVKVGMQQGMTGIKIPLRREWCYLWSISYCFIHQKAKIGLLFFAGEVGHTGEGQSGFRISSKLLLNLLELYSWFFSIHTFFCTSSSIINIRAVPTGLLSDATVVF